MLLPAVNSARENGRRAACTNNLKQLGTALQSFHNSFGHLPQGTHHGNYGLGWGVKILPYLEMGNQYDAIDQMDIPGLLIPIKDPWNSLVFDKVYALGKLVPAGDTVISSFVCPSSTLPSHVPKVSGVTNVNYLKSTGYAVSSYRGSAGFCHGGVLVREPELRRAQNCSGVIIPGLGAPYSVSRPALEFVRFRDIRDGQSNTIAVGESAYVYDKTEGYWPLWIGSPSQDEQTLMHTEAPICCGVPAGIGIWGDKERNLANGVGIHAGSGQECAYSFHSGGAYFVFCDGSVHFLSVDLDLRTYFSMGHIADGEVLGRF